MNTELDLINAVKNFIVENNNLLIANKEGKNVVPQVFKYFTPSQVNKKEEQSVYPSYVIQFLDSVVDSEKQLEDECVMRIIATTTNEDHEQGIDDALKMIRKVKEELNVAGYIGPFALAGKFKLSVPDEQAWPNWVAYIDVNFEIPAVQTDFI